MIQIMSYMAFALIVALVMLTFLFVVVPLVHYWVDSEFHDDDWRI